MKIILMQYGLLRGFAAYAILKTPRFPRILSNPLHLGVFAGFHLRIGFLCKHKANSSLTPCCIRT